MAPRSNDKDGKSGLGRAIINRKFKDARLMHESGNYTTDADSPSNLRSITQEKDLEEFFNTAQLAETDFTAERKNVKIIPGNLPPTHNPYLLSEQEEKSTITKHIENKDRIRVPRRPQWTRKLTPIELDRQEKASFLEWRRDLAQLQDQDGFLLTPFERNLEVWRQLWRVLERSHLIVQIVDARNPLNFRCEDLEQYVTDLEGSEGESGSGVGKRRNLLLINKADLLTKKQRAQWADYFNANGIQFAFFSAAKASAIQQARREAEILAANQLHPVVEVETSLDLLESEEEEDFPDSSSDETETDSDDDEFLFSDGNISDDDKDPRTHIMSPPELESLFIAAGPDVSEFVDQSGHAPKSLVVGLVGYPNVGKSSTINTLLGEKKVSVSATPGKTKHFQTLQLSDTITLCDCPGLVFPQFATTKASLICDGILPIDQIREYTGPTSLVVKRIPKSILAATYGLNIPSQDGLVTAQDMLISYAIARGYMRAGKGNPDEARAARYVLKDYVNGKLLYCHPPPGTPDDSFNEETHERALRRGEGRKMAPQTRVGKDSDAFIAMPTGTIEGAKSDSLDDAFFERDSGVSDKPMMSRGANEFTRSRLFPHQNMVADNGAVLTGRRARIASVLAGAEQGGVGSGKKNHKKVQRAKQRSGKGYD